MTFSWAGAVSEKLSDRRWMTAVIALIAVLMTVKYFPGFENETAYAGNAFQSIYPDAFAGDPYMGPEKPLTARPFQLSLLYVLIHFTGEIWLDDRFAALVYAGLVFAALLGIDRIACLLGAHSPALRLLALAVLMKDHQILGNKVLLAHHPDLNHLAFAIPLIIWLFYAALARKGLFAVLSLSCLLAAVSVRNGVFPPLFALLITAVHGGARTRVLTAAVLAGGLAAAYIGLFHIYPMGTDLRLHLWDLIRTIEHSAANPWHGGWSPHAVISNGVWLAVCAAVFIVPNKTEAGADVRRITLYALALWAAGGLYISAAPDVMKFPLLIDLTPVRALAWPQNLAMVYIAAGAAHWAQHNPDLKKTAVSMAALTALFLTGPGDLTVWAGAVAASAAAVCLAAAAPAAVRAGGSAAALSDLARFIKQKPAAFFASVFMSAALVSYAAAAKNNASGWLTLAQKGVYGNAASAPWIGIDEYFRREKPATASVLALKWLRPGTVLRADRSFSTRSGGHPMPVPEFLGDFMDPEAWSLEKEQKEILAAINSDFVRGDVRSAFAKAGNLTLIPDYIIIPAELAAQPPESAAPYIEETRINGFAVLRRSEKRSQ